MGLLKSIFGDQEKASEETKQDKVSEENVEESESLEKFFEEQKEILQKYDEEINKRDEQIKELLENQEKQEKKIQNLFKVNKDILESLTETTEVLRQEIYESKGYTKKLKEKRNSDLKIFNKNFGFVNQKIKDQNDKFENLIEVVAERFAEKEEIPNIFAPETNLRKMFRRKNKNEAALFSIVYLMKKFFDEKGIRV